MSSPAPPAGALPVLPPVPANIATITAPLLFGIMISWLLYGVLVVQVYIYFMCFPSDKRTFKWLVYSVFLLDSLQTILTGVDSWYWFCAGYGNLIKLSHPYISAFDTPMLGAVISLVVQLFFCYRIYHLGKSIWIPGLITAIALMQTAAALISGIRGAIVQNFSITRAHIDLVSLYIWLIGSAVADTMVAASMSWLLLRSQRTDSHHNRQTADILQRIVRLTVETNSLSASMAIISVILYFSIPNTNYFICPTFFLGKIYSNTLLVAFNNRLLLTSRREQSTRAESSGRFGSRIMPNTPGIESGTTQTITLTPSYKMEQFTKLDEGNESQVETQPSAVTGYGF